ncbi:hypothetical protein VIGAN_04191100, partial [Vigna angularis var. angularis]
STYSNIYPKVSQKASNQIKTANNKGIMLSRKTFNLFVSQHHNKIRNHRVEQLESEKLSTPDLNKVLSRYTIT